MPKRAPTFKPGRASAPIHQATAPSWGKGRGGRPWRRLRDRILKRDGYLCQCERCQSAGLLTVADEVDHVIPISQGGTDTESNLRAINRDCHKSKTAGERAKAR